jgi:hypothetical protein
MKPRKNDEEEASSWYGAGSALSSLIIRNNKARGGETPNTPLYKRIPLPWPLTLIKKDFRQYEEEQLTKSGTGGNRSAMSILLSYCQARATVGLRQMKEGKNLFAGQQAYSQSLFIVPQKFHVIAPIRFQ